MNKNKLKVVWICPLNLIQFKEKLEIKKCKQVVAPWIELLLKEFKKKNNIELHLITISSHINKNYIFYEDKVYFYIIRSGLPFVRRPYPPFIKLDLIFGYKLLGLRIKNIINKINPDIVNLFGTDNQYSISVNYIKFPVLVTIQGIMNDWYKLKNIFCNRILAKNERCIFRQQRNFMIRQKYMEEIINNYNNKARMFYLNLPIKKPCVKNIIAKDSDIIYVARIVKEKGIEDFINVVKIIKNKFPNIRSKVIGPYMVKSYFSFIKKKISSLGLEDNIKLIGYLPTQDLVHVEMAKSKIYVLTSHAETIPGTIIESMCIGIPVIAYDVGAISELNKNCETVILVNKRDEIALSKKINELLENEVKRKELSIKAKKEIEKLYYRNNIADNLIKIYMEIIEESKLKAKYKNG